MNLSHLSCISASKITNRNLQDDTEAGSGRIRGREVHSKGSESIKIFDEKDGIIDENIKREESGLGRVVEEKVTLLSKCQITKVLKGNCQEFGFYSMCEEKTLLILIRQ